MQGGTSGHVSLGLAFLMIGIWHLFNSIKLHSLHPKSFLSLPWFPAPKFKYLEPIAIISITTIFIASELLAAGLATPIPAKNLRHFEHSLIALSFSLYAAFALLLDKLSAPAHAHAHGLLLHLLQAAAFAQQLLILHLHSTDHAGVEGQYHWLLQLVTFVTLVATVAVAGNPASFLSSFVRGFSVVFEGVWLVVMGVMLWTPAWMPEGCFLKAEVVACRSDRALRRAKALVNLMFGLYLIVLSVMVMVFYLVVIRFYPSEKVEYSSLMNRFDEEEKEGDYVLGRKINKLNLSISRSNSVSV